MRKLKLCFVALGVFPDKLDGAAKLIRRLFDEMKRRGHDITMITAKWTDGFKDPDITYIEIPKARFLWVHKFTFKFKKFLKEHDYDIIFSNGSRASLPILFAKKPFIAHIHDVGPFQAGFSPLPFIKWLETRNAKKSDLITTSSESVRPEIVSFMNVNMEKIHNVYCGIDPNMRPMPEEAQELKKKMRIKGPIFYFVGRIAFYKGVEDIIKAFYIAKEQHSDLNLLIGGKPTIKMTHVVEKWKQDYPEVNFVGIISDEEMPVYYTMADAFITYSYASEGFGITPVEALACETPVICSPLPAYKEVLQDHAIFVEPQRADLLGNVFIEFLSDLEKGKQMAKDAQEFIKRYTWEAVGGRIEKLFYQHLNKSNSII